MRLSFSRWNAGLRILLCLTHFSPSWPTSPPPSSLASSGNLSFSKWPSLLDITSLVTSASMIVTLGVGPNQESAVLPCSRTFLSRNGATRAEMSWHRSGSGFDQASLFSRA
ncbi:hypothetical protein PR202_ga16566 [Eleusine coracana subsp. coracana]|uniref:Secreted protein n=1 Tax=Eleusine coracana subsp. coracana TaxID=191504 RepID=A0AAV5CM90_ELECO|nr:hypothetical protein PR202_ga16566 [Eleusine coracana subsp. coracana]